MRIRLNILQPPAQPNDLARKSRPDSSFYGRPIEHCLSQDIAAGLKMPCLMPMFASPGSCVVELVTRKADDNLEVSSCHVVS